MSQREINFLLRRYTLAQNAGGRLLLCSGVMAREVLWQALVRGPEALKRGVDVVLSILALVMLSPLFLLIFFLIKLEDGGPIFFVQTRVGQYGREFKMYKFRSMCLDAEQRLRELLERNQHKQGVTFKIKDDPRVTRTGKWMRKFSLDELPQFYNVLIGDMSVVGPRPPVPREVAKYRPQDRRRLAIKPGITCVWQVSGRADIDFSGQVQLDVSYIETQTFWGDVKILARTVPAVISGKGAC